jgi:hypothetical protein
MEKVAGHDAAPGAEPGAAAPESTAGELVTICAECKRVISLRRRPPRSTSDPLDDERLVSHGICEACARRLYGPIFKRRG